MGRPSSPLSLSSLFWFVGGGGLFLVFFLLSGSLISKCPSHKQTHFITHSFSVHFVYSGYQRWNDMSNYFGVISTSNTTPPPRSTCSFISHCCHHRPLSSSVISHFLFLRLSLTRSLTHTQTHKHTHPLWQVWVSILLFWALGRVNISPQSVNTLTVKTVVPRALNKKIKTKKKKAKN